jgi:hypothetical protein
MLTNLHLENFKSWADVDVEFRGLTGLFGANSSGKSSIIQFILLLKQTKEATDRTLSLDFNGRFVRLGGVNDALHGHDSELTLSWKLDFELENELTIQDPSDKRTAWLVKSDEFSIASSVESGSLGAVGTKLQYWVGDKEFSLERKRGDKNAFDLKAKGLEFKFIRTPGRAWQLPGPNKSYAFPDQARTYYQNASLLADLEATYEEQIDKVYYLGPLREPPKREYVWGKTRPIDVGLRGELVIDAILAASADKRHYNLVHRGRLRSFQEIVAYWLQERQLYTLRNKARSGPCSYGQRSWNSAIASATASLIALSDRMHGWPSIGPSALKTTSTDKPISNGVSPSLPSGAGTNCSVSPRR